MDLLAVLFAILISIRSGQCWPNGAPFKTCVNRFPKHSGSEQQMSPTPYIIEINQTTYRPSQVLQVTLTSNKNTPTPFRGFQIGARLDTSSSSSGGEGDVIVGEWVYHDSQTTRLQYWYPERNGTHNCATHLNNNDKQEIILLWKAPSQNVGDIVFRSGFVKNFSVFWSMVESPKIRSELGATVGPVVTPSPPARVEFSTSDCGRGKGCFLYPPNCHDDDCNFGITYQTMDKDQHSVRFEMIGRGEEYVSMSFSTDELMGGDETVTCISADSHSLIQHGYNPSHNNEHHRNFDLSDKIVTRIDDRIFCSFLRPISASITHIQDNHENEYVNVTDHVKKFDLTEKWFIHMAWGNLYKGSSVLKRHIEAPLVSPRKVDILQHEVVYGVGLPPYLKAHGILAYFSWVFLTGCAMIVARHYRQVLSMKLGGLALWFQIHRGAMFATVVTTAVVIIIVFASLGKWSQRATNHAILGLITMGLALIQIIFGMLRPGLDSSRRPLFNYFHRSVAIVTQILAVTTLILGTQIELLPSELRYILTVIIVVSIAFLLLFEVVLECIRLVVSIKTAKMMPVDENQLQVESSKEPSRLITSMDSVKRVLLFIFVLTAVASLVVFSAYIGIA